MYSESSTSKDTSDTVRAKTSQEKLWFETPHKSSQWRRRGDCCWQAMWHTSSHWQRWGLELAQCATPLTLGLVLYILRAQLSQRVSRCQWCIPVLQVEPLAPPICYPCWRLSPHPEAPNPGVIACHSIRRGHSANPLVPAQEFNLIAWRNLTWHASSSRNRTHAVELATRPTLQLSQRTNPLSHEGRFYTVSNVSKPCPPGGTAGRGGVHRHHWDELKALMQTRKSSTSVLSLIYKDTEPLSVVTNQFTI